MSLRIALDLELPDDAITQAMAILARRGAGKTYTASVLVEEVVGAGLPVVVLDPTGAWWGLRSSADGRKPGLAVVIIGGSHGDVPLEPTAGKVIADVVVEHPGAYVLDLSLFESNAAQDSFVTAFLERLYRAKGTHRDALLLVVDEADSFAPQRPGSNQLHMLGAMEAIVRRGRIRGLGALLITQRAAVLNKNVLTQIEVLVAMQTTSPQDRAAIDAWVEANATKEERADVMGSLASLERGEAWVWSPSWLRILQRVRIRRRRTFDSSATPEAGAVAIVPSSYAKVDLEALDARIAATRERDRANDPIVLKRRIRELELQTELQAKEIAGTSERVVEIPVITRVEVPVLNGQGAELRLTAEALREIANDITAALDRVERSPAPVSAPRAVPRPAGVAVAQETRWAAERAIAEPARKVEDVTLGKAERMILAALASYAGKPRSKRQVALLTGYAVNGGGFGNALGRLRSVGLVEGGKDALTLTAAGQAATTDVEPLPTGEALLATWMGQLGKAERLSLEALVAAYPASLTKQEVAERAGYEANGGGFGNALGRLRTLELIEGGPSAITASADLFG